MKVEARLTDTYAMLTVGSCVQRTDLSDVMLQSWRKNRSMWRAWMI